MTAILHPPSETKEMPLQLVVRVEAVKEMRVLPRESKYRRKGHSFSILSKCECTGMTH